MLNFEADVARGSSLALPDAQEDVGAAFAASTTLLRLSAAQSGDVPIAPDVAPQRRVPDVVALWLHGRSPHTIRAYGSDVAAFFAFTGRPLSETTLADLQAYADQLTGGPSTRGRRLMAVKSLISFAATLGYLPFNVGAALRAPKSENKLAERILAENQVFALLQAVEGHPRDHALIRLLYNGGLRVSEIVLLRWRNLIAAESGAIANVTGKGGKTRVVRLSKGTWAELAALRPTEVEGEARVFPISAWNAWDRVRRAAQRAGLAASPHFLRHSHGTHALRRGADLATVRDTLGHASTATTGRYLHARPDVSSGDYLPI